ncbi:hypothetical protein HNQ80_000026 [Anaerosolibacter carboniphilus]|uniref:Transporter n=1 Tax=Anaerosolibacter carboniphilus TaxID=1417629 RepID=A0A841KKI5_9FIRM|nr:hypothetical protein [Anaerosolibacter carboniphilus]MBB6213957.1 hypothetical protein [Anaerosolibacter carboniphilus]
MVELTLLHWIYVVMVLVILGVMIMRKDTIIPCILGVFLLGLAGTKTILGGTKAVFDSFIVAGTELLGIIVVISCIVAMSKLLEEIGANRLMVTPFKKFIKGPDIAFWFIGIVMLLVSWFFWPSPATALVGAVLLPVALRVGLPAIGVAMAINLFGHGLALSTDFVIQGAPTITATAAGVPVEAVMVKGIPLFFVMGIVTIITAYIMLRRDMKNGKLEKPMMDETVVEEVQETRGIAKFAAFLVPIAFLLDIVAMVMFQLRGGDATSLIGGTAVLIMIIICVVEYKQNALDKITQYIRDGFMFGMEIFGPIIPIAAFFYMGEVSPLQAVLGEGALPAGSQGILSDMGSALASVVPMNRPVAASIEMVVGAITGLDGSGFSGMSLAGSLAKVFGTAIHGSIPVLAALGQIGAIWVGGGTIVPWGLIPAAAICRVLPMDLARRNFIPVVIGLVVTTIVAMFLI